MILVLILCALSFKWVMSHVYRSNHYLASCMPEIVNGQGYVAARFPEIRNDPNRIADNYIVYPNPVNDQLNLQLPDSDVNRTIQLVTVLDQPIYEEKINGSSKSIDVSGLSKGMYLLKVSDENGNHLKTIKVLKD